MKIMMLVRSLHIGGMEKMVIELSQELNRRGHEVEIICLEEAGTLAPQAGKLGLKLRSLDKGPGLRLKTIPKLRRIIREEGFDLVHSHNPLGHFYGALARAGLHRTPLVHTSHQICHPANRREWVYAWLASRLTRRVIGVSVAASRSFIEKLGLAEKRSRTIMNGLDLDPYLALPLPDPQARGVLVIGTVGRLAEVKNQKMMIRGLAELKARGITAQLRLIGDGELRQDLEQLVSTLDLTDRVTFVGFSDQIPQQLSQIDVFSLTSRHEGMPLSLIEAMASGRGIVVTAVGGMPEMVSEGTEGRLIPAGDVNAFADTMASLLADPQMLTELAQGARAHARARYSVGTMATAYESAYGL